jgi:hypothetical protein
MSYLRKNHLTINEETEVYEVVSDDGRTVETFGTYEYCAAIVEQDEPPFQIVADRHGAIETSYAWSREWAERQAAEMQRVCACGKVHGVEIREAGDFVPDDES